MIKNLYKLFCYSLIIFTFSAIAQEGFVSVNEGNLYYQVVDNRPTVIVLHGGPGLDQSYLLPQMTELAKHNRIMALSPF